jgi:hypothetical protein
LFDAHPGDLSGDVRKSLVRREALARSLIETRTHGSLQIAKQGASTS